MRILIVSATAFEIAPLITCLKGKPLHSGSRQKGLGKLDLKAGDQLKLKHNKNQIDILITGIGMTSTAYWLGKTLSPRNDRAYQFGVAGSFNRKLELGEVVQVTEDCFSELGAEDGEKFLPLYKMGLPGTQDISNKNYLPALKKVRGITVNTVHGNDGSIQKIKSRWKADVESMEGAAFLYACNMHGTPCVQVRAISNYVERRNKKVWKMELAVKNLNEAALRIIEAINF